MFFQSSCEFIREYVANHGGDIFFPCPKCGGVPSLVVTRRDDYDGACLVFCPKHPDRSFQVIGRDLLTVYERAVGRWNSFVVRTARK